jgi:hypothetical protein
MKNSVVWDTTTYSPTESYECFRETLGSIINVCVLDNEGNNFL